MKSIKLALSYDDVLLVPKYSQINSRSEVDLSTAIAKNLTLKIPLISTKMDTVTGVEMAIKMGQLGGMGILPRFDPIEIQADKVKKVAKKGVVTAAAIGVKEGYFERANALVKAGATVIDIDVAHGHMEKTLEVTRRIKQGFGVPSITALLDTARAARKFKKTFMPDAGIRGSADVVKALATGASAIVGGNVFADTDETPGEIIMLDWKKYKTYNGSASKEEKVNQVKKDGSDKNGNYVKQIEGVAALVSYKGSVESVVESILVGVRSGLSYAGARNIPELWKKAEFIRITQGGVKENGAHDVIMKPNDSYTY